MKQSPLKIVALFLLSLLCLDIHSQAAVVGPAGYTNDFSVQPVAADWATLSRNGAGNDTYDLDADVATITAAGVTARTSVATADPAAQLAQATWSSAGFYLQTRPTGNRWTALMGKFVNNTGTNATEINLSYLFTVGPPATGGGGGATTAEETGTKVYYSLTGQTNSWINLAALNNISAAAGSVNLSTNVGLNWTNGGSLYLLWVDDNASQGTDPGNEIDNFSLSVTAGAPPAMTVSVTSPVNGGLFLSSTVPSASAAVAFGTAPFTVQYFISSGAGNTSFTSAGSSATAPYNVNLGALTPGTYNIYAVVTDSAGTPATATSTTNTFDVADPILITLDSPANNATLDNSTPVNGSVSVSGGTAPYSVQFYLDNVASGAAISAPPFQHNFGALFVGDHAIKATVTDAHGWVSNSPIANVHITGPLGVDLAPTNGASVIFGQPVVLTAAPGGGTGPYSVIFYTNDQVAATITSPPYVLDLGVLPVGSFTSYAHASDSSTPSAQQANSTTNTISVLPNPIVVTLTSPTNNQTAVSGQPFTMAATASVLAPVNVSNVEFFFDGISLGVDNTAPYNGQVPNVTDGTHTAYALATDSLGRKAYSPTNTVTSVLDPLANDNFANRFAIGTPALVNGANVLATVETGEPASQGFITWGASLWYKWTPPITGRATITINAPFQLLIGAYTGTDVAALTSVGNNISGFGTANTFSFNVVGGTEYAIQAAGIRPFGPGGGGQPATGSFQFQLAMPPTVTIDSPTNRSVFPANSNVLVSATAVAAVGTISKVDFYRLGSPSILLASVSNAPYQFVYSNSIPATNSLVAVATDTLNQSSTSPTVNIGFFSDGVTIVSPADGTIFGNSNPIRVSVVGLLASGTITNVEFFVDDQKFAETGILPFTGVWSNVVAGSHRLTARGTDSSGDTWQSLPVFISVPKVLVAFGSVWKYLDDNSDQGTAWIAPSFNDSTWASGPAPLGYGDSNGRPEATTNSFGLDPANKFITTYYRQTFTATGVAAITNYSLTIERDDGAVVYLNGVEIGRFNMPAGVITKDTFAAANAQDDGGTQFTIPVNSALLQEGPNVFAVEIHQDSLNSSDIWFQMQLVGIPPVIRNAAPSVSISSPSELANFLAPLSVPIQALASDSDGSVNNVQFFVDGVKIGEDASSPYSVSWDLPSIGAHILTAVATDDRGATTTSAGVRVNIYDAAGSPFAKITAPADGTIVEGPINIPVTATASALDSVTHVEFFANGVSFGDDASFPYGVLWAAPFGTNALTAVAYGADGKTGTSVVTTVIVTIPPTNTVAPFIVSQNPPAGSTVTSLTNIQITFSERVQGVNAGDLLINGIPATGVTGSGSNYNFTFPQPPYFEVTVTWAANHGITDFGYPANLPFDELAVESRWEYDLIDRTPPIIVSHTPAQNALVTNLAQIVVKFSEPVTGVDPSDLLVNGTAATAVVGDGTNFTFTVVQPASGIVTVSWSSTNNIFDLGADGANAFDGTNAVNIWTFNLDARTILVQTNSANWLLLKGLAEASDPTNAWRDIAFDASTWSSSPAPFFYGDPYSNGVPAYTLLSDMRSNYSSIFLRKEFVIDNRSVITNLYLAAQSDDGFIAWINGVEVQRYNMATGELAFNATALTASPEPNNNGAAYIVYALTNVDSYLVNGTNVLAVQAFNESLTASSDFGFNAQLYTYLTDIARTPPRIIGATPASGGTPTSLKTITVTFSEPVSGVNASDMLINGVAATNLVTTNNMIYTFGFAQPAFGQVTVTWATNHGISDFDSPPKSFNGNAAGSILRYTLINLLAPLVSASSIQPVAGSTNISLTNVTLSFTKAVVGVNASDFLVNGIPATGMISNSATSYKFTFPQPPFGLVAISWATNHGIHDTTAAANEFDALRAGSRWNYTLIDPVPSVTITNPANGKFFQAPANLTLRATASDNDGTVSLVEFFSNGAKLGEAATPPYTYQWTNILEGSYVIRAVVTDNSGLHGTSAPVSITVITSVPINLVRGPYLQVGTPVSGTVRWRTDINSDSVVFYGTDPNALTNSVVLPALITEHIVPLTGLQPKTQYYYTVGSSDQPLAFGTNFWFKTNPTIGTREKTRFWVLGDSGTANNNQRAVRDSFYNYAATNGPADFWLMLGDNAYNSGLDSEYQSAVFNMYPEALRNMFLWPTLGNHETAQAFTIADFPYLHIFTLPQNGEAGGVPSGSPRYYSFDYANIHFISLDSMSSGRTTNTAMVRWLVNDLEATAQEWTVVYFHHPPYTKGSHNSDAETELIEIRQNILPILESYGVDLVLSGHSHCYERSYLLNGHYGLSTALTPAMKIDGGDGRDEGTGSYHKNEVGQGVVYMVAGNGGQATGGSLNHPAHFLSLNELGSLVIDVVSNRLQVTMLATNGVTRDQSFQHSGIRSLEFT